MPAQQPTPLRRRPGATPLATAASLLLLSAAAAPASAATGVENNLPYPYNPCTPNSSLKLGVPCTMDNIGTTVSVPFVLNAPLPGMDLAVILHSGYFKMEAKLGSLTAYSERSSGLYLPADDWAGERTAALTVTRDLGTFGKSFSIVAFAVPSNGATAAGAGVVLTGADLAGLTDGVEYMLSTAVYFPALTAGAPPATVDSVATQFNLQYNDTVTPDLKGRSYDMLVSRLIFPASQSSPVASAAPTMITPATPSFKIAGNGQGDVAFRGVATSSEVCPFLTTFGANDTLTCGDGTTCPWTAAGGCCLKAKGVHLCPDNKREMCSGTMCSGDRCCVAEGECAAKGLAVRVCAGYGSLRMIPSGSPTPPHPHDDGDDGGITGGGVFLIIFFVGFVGLYCFLSMGWRFFNGARKCPEIMPHHTFWMELPSLVKEGIFFTQRKICGSKAGGGAGGGGAGGGAAYDGVYAPASRDSIGQTPGAGIAAYGTAASGGNAVNEDTTL